MFLNAAEILLLLLVFALGAITSWLFRKLHRVEEQLNELMSIRQKTEEDSEEEDVVRTKW